MSALCKCFQDGYQELVLLPRNITHAHCRISSRNYFLVPWTWLGVALSQFQDFGISRASITPSVSDFDSHVMINWSHGLQSIINDTASLSAEFPRTRFPSLPLKQITYRIRHRTSSCAKNKIFKAPCSELFKRCITVFWDVTSYGLEDIYRRFGGTYSYHQDRLVRGRPGQACFYRNVGKILLVCCHPASYSAPWRHISRMSNALWAAWWSSRNVCCSVV